MNIKVALNWLCSVWIKDEKAVPSKEKPIGMKSGAVRIWEDAPVIVDVKE